jgi:hypothetical protein
MKFDLLTLSHPNLKQKPDNVSKMQCKKYFFEVSVFTINGTVVG